MYYRAKLLSDNLNIKIFKLLNEFLINDYSRSLYGLLFSKQTALFLDFLQLTRPAETKRRGVEK